MNDDKRRQSGQGLPLPSPRPSPELDRRILSYARSRAPQRSHRAAPRWAAPLATAAVVAVAVLLALPPGPDREVASKAEQRSAVPAAPAPAATVRAEPQPSRRLHGEAAGAMAPAADSALSAAKATMADTPRDVAAQEATAAEPLAALLAPIAALLEAGDEAGAREAYAALRDRCPDCELPETLEQALAEREPPPPP